MLLNTWNGLLAEEVAFWQPVSTPTQVVEVDPKMFPLPAMSHMETGGLLPEEKLWEALPLKRSSQQKVGFVSQQWNEIDHILFYLFPITKYTGVQILLWSFDNFLNLTIAEWKNLR